MTAEPVIQRNTIRVDCERGSTAAVSIDEVFVAFSSDSDQAYMVHPCGNEALHWTEISTRSAELLVVLGAHAEVDLSAAAASRLRRGIQASP